MRKITVSEFVSLDGVIENPRWLYQYWNDEIAAFKCDELFAHDALLLGCATYDGFARAWPHQTDEEGYAARMNRLPKHVLTTTLKHACWNNTRLIKANAVEEIRRLKAQDGQDILVFGSGTVVRTLMDNRLVDQYTLLIHPVVLGTGKRLFQEGISATLTLVESRSFSSGVTALIYQPASS